MIHWIHHISLAALEPKVSFTIMVSTKTGGFKDNVTMSYYSN